MTQNLRNFQKKIGRLEEKDFFPRKNNSPIVLNVLVDQSSKK